MTLVCSSCGHTKDEHSFFLTRCRVNDCDCVIATSTGYRLRDVRWVEK